MEKEILKINIECEPVPVEVDTYQIKASVKPNTMPKLQTIEIVRFQRTEFGEWERGILLNNAEMGIIDQYGKFIDQCWEWRRTHEFMFDIGSLINCECDELGFRKVNF